MPTNTSAHQVLARTESYRQPADPVEALEGLRTAADMLSFEYTESSDNVVGCTVEGGTTAVTFRDGSAVVVYNDGRGFEVTVDADAGWPEA